MMEDQKPFDMGEYVKSHPQTFDSDFLHFLEKNNPKDHLRKNMGAGSVALIFDITGYRKQAVFWCSYSGNWNSPYTQIRVYNEGNPPLGKYSYVTGEWYAHMENDCIPKHLFIKWFRVANEMMNQR